MVLGVPKEVVAWSLVNSCLLDVSQNTGSAIDLLRHGQSDLVGAEAVSHVVNGR